jgi:dTDP-4-dehydrorhamnose reductase
MVLKKVLLTGGSGTLGTELLRIYDRERYIFLSPSSGELDIAGDVEAYFEKNPVDLVIHCAAYTDVKRAESEYLKALDINVKGTLNIIQCCAKRDIKLVFISTEHVFDGKQGLYKPEDPINPVASYAKTKGAAELCVRSYPKSLCIRTSFYGYTFPYEAAFEDQWSSKDYVDVIAPKILSAALSDKFGVVHVGSQRRSIYEIAVLRRPDVKKIRRADIAFPTPRDTSLEDTDA